MSRTRSLVRRGAVMSTALAVGVSLLGPAGSAGASDTARASDTVRTAESPRPHGDDALRYREKRDPRGDVKYPRRNRTIDIRWMQAWPHVKKKPRFMAVRIKGYAFARASRKRNIADLFINLQGTGPKPDFRVIKHLPRDGDGLNGARLLKVRGWNKTVRRKPCQGLRVPFNAKLDRVQFFVPRRCINARGGRLFQVHTRMWNIFRYSDTGQPVRGWLDEVPNRKRKAEPRFLRGWV